MVVDDVAGLDRVERIRLLGDVDGLVEVLEDPVEERERGLHVEADAEQRADREEEARLQRGERDEIGIEIDGEPCASARPPNQ